MPSVLVEVGFLTNKREGAYLNTKKGQSSMAKAIKNAIIAYKKELDQNISTNIAGLNEDISNEYEDLPQVYSGVTFKVQIAASSKNLAPKSYNFNGLSDITKDKVGNLYKYYYGDTSDYSKVKQLLQEAKTKGYTSSCVVAYKNGERIDVSEVLKSSTN